MSVINTNVNALFAQSAMKTNAREMSSAMQQLATGNRINSAGDDAAGVAVVQSMTAQIRGLNQAVRNANDAVNLLQTAEGSMVEQTNMLQRMRELAVQAANGTYSSTQRNYLQTEFDELGSQIDDISADTTWNGKQLLDATDATGINGISGQFDFQVGQDSGQTISVSIDDMSLSGLGADGLDISTASGASTAIETLDDALDLINAQRADIGAGINRLTYAADNLSNVSANVAASRSTIQDTDYASASTELSRAQIIQQASTAMLAQANQQPQTVLALLK
jgi:flagellin